MIKRHLIESVSLDMMPKQHIYYFLTILFLIIFKLNGFSCAENDDGYVDYESEIHDYDVKNAEPETRAPGGISDIFGFRRRPNRRRRK